jgi:TonB family protein
MSGKTKISSLFDVSGNLTAEATERYLHGELNEAEISLVKKHLEDSPFDREALEGLQKHYSSQNFDEIDKLRKSVILATGKIPETEKRILVPRTYWYAAAGLILLMGVSVFMVLMFRTPLNKTELAVLQPDTIVSTATATGTAIVQEDQKQSVSENDIVPVTSQVTRINIVEDDVQAAEKELADEPGAIVYDDVIVDADMIVDEEFIGGVAAYEDSVLDEYPIASEMAASESSRGMTKMAAASETEMTEESQIFMVVEQMPEFPGGEEALYKYLAGNITYPQSAKESGIQGRVYVTFVVERDGTISDVRVLRGIGGGCDEEAIRVVKAMPKWMPGKQRSKPVRVQYNLPVKFSLE